MAKMGLDSKYQKTFKSGSKEFAVVNGVWELMKIAETPELRRICKMLFDAFIEYEGSVDDIREIWIEWWVIFQTFYQNDNTDEYWQTTFDHVNAFNEKYRNTAYTNLVLKLSTMIMDYQQFRRDKDLL